MCHSPHQTHARHRGSQQQAHFDSGESAFDWREFFMRGGPRGFGGHGGDDDGGFGVRRPLRFLAHKLQLDEKQIVELARILDELKTERAQIAVDGRRTLAEYANAIAGEAFDAAQAAAAGDRRVASAPASAGCGGILVVADPRPAPS